MICGNQCSDADPTNFAPGRRSSEACRIPGVRTNINPASTSVRRDNTLIARYHTTGTDNQRWHRPFTWLAAIPLNPPSTPCRSSDTQVFGSNIVMRTRYPISRERRWPASRSVRLPNRRVRRHSPVVRQQSVTSSIIKTYEFAKLPFRVRGNHILKFGGRVRALRRRETVRLPAQRHIFIFAL